MTIIAPGTTLIDLQYLGHAGHIASCALESEDGLLLVDTGPATTLDALVAGVEALGASLSDVRKLLITHIHLDHSGAAGILADLIPGLEVYVHERGAPHLVDPTKLLRSATMLYGDQMERLWGEVRPLPAEALRPMTGGEMLRAGSRTLRAAYTPGHAWHHLAWFDERSGIAFTGDVVGEQPPGSTRAVPVTPPPDIDVEEMHASAARILDWRPARLFLTHFGVVADPPSFVAEHGARLERWSGMVRASLDHPGTDLERAAAHAREVRPEVTAGLSPEQDAYIREDTLQGNWLGLARYWRKRPTA